MSVWTILILSVFSPPPDEKTPVALIYSWGIEMLRLGFELAAEMFLPEEDDDEQHASQCDLQH